MRTDAKQFSLRVIGAFVEGNDRLIVELHDEANQDYQFYLDVWSNLPSGMRARIKETVDNYDPTPWCAVCGARKREDCGCGPLADND